MYVLCEVFVQTFYWLLNFLGFCFQKYCLKVMAVEEQESGIFQWSRHIFDFDTNYAAYQTNLIQEYPSDVYHGQYFTEDAECNNVENDEMIARTLQEEISLQEGFSQLAIAEAPQYSHSQEYVGEPIYDHDRSNLSNRNYSSGIWRTC